MAKKTQIIPAILADHIDDFKRQWSKVSKHFKLVQIDIMDGEFVATHNDLSPRKIKNIIKRQPIEIHLMVKDINTYIGQWSTCKNVQKIIWHYQALPDEDAISQAVRWLKKQKIKTGLAINPKIPLKQILSIAKKFDTILVMGVTPGQMGQKFQKKSLSKIKKLRKQFPNLNIEVDGGINDKNFKAVTKTGANLVVVGSYLQQADDIKTALSKLQ
jgi:ribulose-phosphate 3-epimerase